MPLSDRARFYRPPVPVLWFDLETTRLDPQKDTILEVAVDYWRKDMCYDLLGCGRVWSAVVRHDTYELYDTSLVSVAFKDRMDPRVFEMHRESGLLSDLDRAYETGSRIYEIEDILLDLVDGTDKIVLAGNSVDFDRSFVKEHMPELAARLSHRTLDVSGPFMYGFPEVPAYAGKAAHRAGPDLVRSQAIFLHTRRHLLG